jgi:hypothetical protein
MVLKVPEGGGGTAYWLKFLAIACFDMRSAYYGLEGVEIKFLKW